METRPLRILHREDNPADAEAVQRTLERAGLPCLVLRVTTEEEFARGVEELNPDIVLCDHVLEMFGVKAALEHIRAVRRNTPVIVVTAAMNEQLVIDYVRSGVADYVFKSNLGRLAPAIAAARTARQGLERLTPRQHEVLRLMAEGLSTGEIARQLQLSIKTIETHRMALMDRLGIHNLVGLFRFAVHVGLVPPAN